MQSSSIVRERRIGKSSLLYQLSLSGTQRTDSRYFFFYIDLQEASCHTAHGFLKNILKKLGVQGDIIKPKNSLNLNL
ncbi:MAG: hypothetical protein JNN15_09025 [Blastocatellia bacterium]|nr:hypothetical protein [Blastocatellia bacterium]